MNNRLLKKGALMAFFICIILVIFVLKTDPIYACQTYCAQKPREISSFLLDGTPTPGDTTSTQQLVTMSQNDVAVANSIITWSGVFLAIVATTVSIAVFLGIRELRLIQKTRAEFEKHIEKISLLEKDVENKLKQLSLKIEHESQTLIEIAYDFSIATEAYKTNDFERAIEYYSRVQSLQPTNLRVLERLGRSYTNLNETQKAVQYLEQALQHDARYAPALRGLSTVYRYIDRNKALDYIKRALDVDPSDIEGWNYIGLLYRDAGLIDEAILSHEKSLTIKNLPETEFFLSILYAHKGDIIRAKLMALAAQVDSQKREHAERLRSIWSIVIKCGLYIIENNEQEALKCAQDMTNYITTDRTLSAITSHIRSLLQATNHKSWIVRFDNILKVKGAKNAKP